MIKPEKKPVVRLAGEDGNAFSIMGRVVQALRRVGADDEYIGKYRSEAMAGDYDNLLCVTMDYVEVE